MAAGLSLPEENVEKFRKKINENATLTDQDFIPKIVIDVPMPLEYINFSLISQLNALEPFGKGNEKPIFAVKGIQLVSARVLGKNKNVLKLKIRMSNLGIMEAVFPICGGKVWKRTSRCFVPGRKKPDRTVVDLLSIH